MGNSREQRIRRHRRVRSKVKGTSARPRVLVFRSAKHIYAQIIDDEAGHTLAQGNDSSVPAKTGRKAKTDIAKMVGLVLGTEIVRKGVKKVVFDRGGYKYHGRVRALAEGLRKAGVKF